MSNNIYKLSPSEAGHLGAIASRKTCLKQYGERIRTYKQNPTKCENCEKPLNYKHRKDKFCSQSCSGSFNNKGVRRHGTSHYCDNCSTQIPSGKFCNTDCQWEHQILPKVLIGEASSGSCKKHLLKITGHKCNKCGNTEWNGLPVPIELEHIDGNSQNNNLNNLELLCPNCHAQTPTYKNRNKGNGRHYRQQRYAAGLSY